MPPPPEVQAELERQRIAKEQYVEFRGPAGPQPNTALCPKCTARTAKRYTAEEVVLLAILRLEKRIGCPEHDHDTIAVEAWSIDPATFKMKGYPYPDTKRVSVTLTQLASTRRYEVPQVEIAYSRNYRLTDAGRERVKKLEQ